MSKHFLILALTWLVMAVVFFLEKHILVGVVETCVCVFDLIVALISYNREKKAAAHDDGEIVEEFAEEAEE